MLVEVQVISIYVYTHRFGIYFHIHRIVDEFPFYSLRMLRLIPPCFSVTSSFVAKPSLLCEFPQCLMIALSSGLLPRPQISKKQFPACGHHIIPIMALSNAGKVHTCQWKPSDGWETPSTSHCLPIQWGIYMCVYIYIYIYIEINPKPTKETIKSIKQL